ncbi:MAG: hypothetical protein RLZZ198_1889, partial [Bacteroidota bacterium]
CRDYEQARVPGMGLNPSIKPTLLHKARTFLFNPSLKLAWFGTTNEYCRDYEQARVPGMGLNPSIKPTLLHKARTFLFNPSLKLAWFGTKQKSPLRSKWTFFVIPLGFEPRAHTLKVYCSTS